MIDLTDIEYLREQHINFAMPCYGGQLTEASFQSFISWTAIAQQLGISWTVHTITNESLISRARNTLVAQFLENPTLTHLMFVDADISWQPHDVLALLSAKKHIIGGLYPMKKFPISNVINQDANMVTQGNIREVTKTGTGFMMISREAFKHLDEHENVESYQNDTGLDIKFNPFTKNYFDTSIRDGIYLSEDWTFCENWRDLGGKIWIHDLVKLGHVGTHQYKEQQ